MQIHVQYTGDGHFLAYMQSCWNFLPSLLRVKVHAHPHRVHIFTRDDTGTQGWCVCPLSWSVHCNFTGDGKGCTHHPYQPGLILPSWWNVRQKAAVATLCTLCPPLSLYLPPPIELRCPLHPLPSKLLCSNKATLNFPFSLRLTIRDGNNWTNLIGFHGWGGGEGGGVTIFGY